MAAQLQKQKVNLDDIDDLLDQLTEEELLELNGDFDPDNSMLPPSERCKNQTDKAPTGPFNRKKLMKFIEEQAKKEKDWELSKEYVKEQRGKVWVPKEKKKEKLFGMDEEEDGEDVETEWDTMLEKATEEELVDLAAVLGFYSIMNQDQFNASLEGKEVSGDFRGVAKATQFPSLPFEPPNDTNVDDVIEKLEADDSKLTEVNLNNMKNISNERLTQICESLKTNTSLKKLSMANTALTDKVAKSLAEALHENKNLQSLNVESNFIGGDSIVALLDSINTHQSVTEIRLANQRSPMFGVRTETRIAETVELNDKLKVIGMAFEVPNARNRVERHIQNNKDKEREARRASKK